MKKLLITCLLLTFICLPVLSSCSKKEESCMDCRTDSSSHVTLSFGMKDGETKTYDLSKETVKIYLDFHIRDMMFYNEFSEMYGKNIASYYAIVSDYHKPKEEIPHPKVLMSGIAADKVCEMAFRDTYYHKIKVNPREGNHYYKWYKETLEIVYPTLVFQEGEHCFYVSTSRTLSLTQYNYRSWYYKREGNKLEIRKEGGWEEYWGDNNFDERAFWETYTPGYGGY